MVKSQRTIAILQARMGSSRLPGKVLLDIAGQPMLARVVQRVRHAHLLDEVVVATTQDSSDDPLADYCRKQNIPCMRGSQFDVLDRFHQAAQQQKADIVVRITADCPVIDPLLIDEAMLIFKGSLVDFAANRLPPPYTRSYPIGLDIEICTFNALQRAWQEADQPYQREHVMPYLYEEVELDVKSPTRSEGSSRHGFKVLQLNHVPDLGSLRWTVDTAADLEFICQVFAHFEGRDDFSWLEMLALVQTHPELSRLNDEVRHKSLHEVDERGNK